MFYERWGIMDQVSENYALAIDARNTRYPEQSYAFNADNGLYHIVVNVVDPSRMLDKHAKENRLIPKDSVFAPDPVETFLNNIELICERGKESLDSRTSNSHGFDQDFNEGMKRLYDDNHKKSPFIQYSFIADVKRNTSSVLDFSINKKSDVKTETCWFDEFANTGIKSDQQTLSEKEKCIRDGRKFVEKIHSNSHMNTIYGNQMAKYSYSYGGNQENSGSCAVWASGHLLKDGLGEFAKQKHIPLMCSVGNGSSYAVGYSSGGNGKVTTATAPLRDIVSTVNAYTLSRFLDTGNTEPAFDAEDMDLLAEQITDFKKDYRASSVRSYYTYPSKNSSLTKRENCFNTDIQPDRVRRPRI